MTGRPMTLMPPLTPARNADRRSGPTGPTARRRTLGTALRQLREERSLLLEEVACRLGVAPSTLSRIETGKAPTRTSYLTLLMDLYAIDDPGYRSQLADLAREGQRKGWWDDHPDIIPPALRTYYGLESAAVLIRAYAPHAIPDLLQTPAYALAAARAARPGVHPATARRHAAITTSRVQHLNPDAHLHAILDETALIRPLTPAHDTAGQLEHLHALASTPTVTVQITRLSATLPVLTPPFSILTFATPDEPDIATYPSPAGHLITTTRHSDTDTMQALFTALARAAATPAESAELITELASQPQHTGTCP
jgi:transcriptional regulator with XRE-family HTH domain